MRSLSVALGKKVAIVSRKKEEIFFWEYMLKGRIKEGDASLYLINSDVHVNNLIRLK